MAQAIMALKYCWQNRALSYVYGFLSLVSYPDPHRSCGWTTSPPTRVVGLVSCTNFCPVAPECCSDQSDLRYALIAYSSYQSKLSVMAVRLEMDDVQVIRAIQSAGERMGHEKGRDEQFRVIEDVVRGRDTFVAYQQDMGSQSLLRRSAMGI